jgi:hypothetical protein
MRVSKSFRTVTPFSKSVALALFIALPIIAFLFGAKWQKIQDMAIISELSHRSNMENSQMPHGVLRPQNYDGGDDNIIKVNGTPIPYGL